INRHYGRTETESVDSMLTEFTDTAIGFTRTDGVPAPPHSPAVRPPVSAPRPTAAKGRRGWLGEGLVALKKDLKGTSDDEDEDSDGEEDWPRRRYGQPGEDTTPDY